MIDWLATVLRVLVKAAQAWFNDQIPRTAAGLAFYTSFSMAPLLLIVIAVVSTVYSGAEQDLVEQLTRMVPGGGADAVRIVVEGLNRQQGSSLAAGLGLLALGFGATGVFVALQDGLNQIWGIARSPGSAIRHFLLKRLFSFAMVVVVALLLLISLLINSLLGLVVSRFGGMLPGGAVLWHVVNGGIAIGTATGVFALVFKYVPDATVRWRPALLGGLVTAGLFLSGEFAMAWYVGRAGWLSVYGIFGSLIVFLLWVYYSAQIVLFGAAFTKIYSTYNRQPSR